MARRIFKISVLLMITVIVVGLGITFKDSSEYGDFYLGFGSRAHAEVLDCSYGFKKDTVYRSYSGLVPKDACGMFGEVYASIDTSINTITVRYAYLKLINANDGNISITFYGDIDKKNSVGHVDIINIFFREDINNKTVQNLTIQYPSNTKVIVYRHDASYTLDQGDRRINYALVNWNKEPIEGEDKVINVNNYPDISIIHPSSNEYVSASFVPTISVSDPDGDTLTCKYYIDSVEKETKIISNTETAQVVSFSTLDTSAISNGKHNMV